VAGEVAGGCALHPDKAGVEHPPNRGGQGEASITPSNRRATALQGTEHAPPPSGPSCRAV